MSPFHLSPNKDFSRIRLLCCDVDGVLTDGSFYYDANGTALLRFYVQDGIGLKRLIEGGIQTCFITQSNNPIIKKRAEVLGIHYCLMGVEDKRPAIEALIQRNKWSWDEVCHIADDINDLTLLKAVGIPVTVPDGVEEVRSACRFHTQRQGGNGAVRELCDTILNSKGL